MLLTITVFAKEDSIGSTLLERISYIQKCAGPMPLLLTISLVILYILAEICFIIYNKKFKNIKNDLKENKTSDYLPVVYGVRAISLILIVMFHIWEQTWIFYNLRISETKLFV